MLFSDKYNSNYFEKHHALIIKDKHTIIIDNESSKDYIEFKTTNYFTKLMEMAISFY